MVDGLGFANSLLSTSFRSVVRGVQQVDKPAHDGASIDLTTLANEQLSYLRKSSSLQLDRLLELKRRGTDSHTDG